MTTDLIIDELGPIPDPGVAWPHSPTDKWHNVIRLLAYWRWAREGHKTGATNARNSIECKAPFGRVFEP